MPRKLKRPDGMILEEFVASSAHIFENGKLTCHDHSLENGEYTGRFAFLYKDTQRTTRWYTRKSAPKWLLAMYRESIV